MAFLKWEDYVVLVITVALSLGMGLYQSLRGGKVTTTSKYIMGDGKMAILPVALSLLVSYESGIMLLGIPAEVYLYGMQILLSFVGFVVADLFGMYVFIPHLKRLEITSIFEYLEMRFDSHGIRLFGTILSILFGVNYMGTVLAMPAVALKAVAGIDVWTSIIGLMAVVLIYTLIGGFKAVIWSDVVQAALMFGGMIAVIIKGTLDAGGLAATWQTVYDTGRLNLFVFDADPTVRHSFWSVFVGSIVVGLWRPFMQTSFLRIKATPNVQTTQRMFLISSLLSLVIPLLTAVSGAIMFAYYNKKGCDPLSSKLDNSNQLMAAMVTEIFQDMPCLPGLFLSALFSASLSTISSVLSSCSAIFWEDVIKPHSKVMSERRGILITKLSGRIHLHGLMAAMVTEIFQDMPCLPGLFLSALFSASLSTISSVLSSCSAIFWEDVIKPHSKVMSERRGILITKLSVLGFGVIGVALAILVSQVEGPVLQIFITTSGVAIGTIGGIFILGWTIPWANKLGALAGGSCSVLVVGWITLSKMISSGIRRSPKLEPPSIENCLSFNISTTKLYTTTFTSTRLYNMNVTMVTADAMDVTIGQEDLMDGPYGLDVLYSISYRWLTPMSIIIVVLVGAIVSRLTERTTVAPELVVPVCDMKRCCTPQTIMESLHCAVKYHHPNKTNPDEAEMQGNGDIAPAI